MRSEREVCDRVQSPTTFARSKPTPESELSCPLMMEKGSPACILKMPPSSQFPSRFPASGIWYRNDVTQRCRISKSPTLRSPRKLSGFWASCWPMLAKAELAEFTLVHHFGVSIGAGKREPAAEALVE